MEKGELMRLVKYALPIVLVSAVPAKALLVTDVAWPNIDSYCTFQRAEQKLVYDDPETWKFVFFSNVDGSGMNRPETAFAAIRYQLHELELVDSSETAGGETRTYRTFSGPDFSFMLDLSVTEEGGEYTSYKGTMTVEGDGETETIQIHGDCGV